MSEVRYYKVVKLVEGHIERWMVASPSLRDDDTWDVIDTFARKHDAKDYVTSVQARQLALS